LSALRPDKKNSDFLNAIDTNELDVLADIRGNNSVRHTIPTLNSCW